LVEIFDISGVFLTKQYSGATSRLA